MSRSGYTDDCENMAMWRGAVASSIRGKRGQAFLRDLLKSLDAMPEKRLVANELEADGEVCAIGSVGRDRGIDLSKVDPEDSDQVAALFDIARPLACEIVYVNDEAAWKAETPEERWARVRKWVAEQIQ